MTRARGPHLAGSLRESIITIHLSCDSNLTGSRGKFLRRGVCRQSDILGRCAGEKPVGRGPVRGSAIAQEREEEEDPDHGKSPESSTR